MRRIVTSTYRYKRPPRKRKGPARISRPGRAATDPEPCRVADSPAGRFPRRWPPSRVRSPADVVTVPTDPFL